MSQLYCAPDAGDLIRRELDSMSLIYHRQSGITHMVADPIPAILEIITEKPATADTVAENLRNIFEIESEGDVLDIVRARLEELCELGLVQRVSD